MPSKKSVATTAHPAWPDHKLLPVIKRAIYERGVVAVARAVNVGLPALRVYVNGGGKTGIVRPGTRALIERFADSFVPTGVAFADRERGGKKAIEQKATRRNKAAAAAALSGGSPPVDWLDPNEKRPGDT